MLILTQGREDTVVIVLRDGSEVRVTVLGVTGSKVRVGYDAPRDIVIDREVIHERKKAERAL